MALAYEEAARLEGDLSEALLQRDEMEEQRDRARDLAAALEEELHGLRVAAFRVVAAERLRGRPSIASSRDARRRVGYSRHTAILRLESALGVVSEPLTAEALS